MPTFDRSRAIGWLERACACDHLDAFAALGQELSSTDPSRAFELFVAGCPTDDHSSHPFCVNILDGTPTVSDEVRVLVDLLPHVREISQVTIGSALNAVDCHTLLSALAGARELVAQD